MSISTHCCHNIRKQLGTRSKLSVSVKASNKMIVAAKLIFIVLPCSIVSYGIKSILVASTIITDPLIIVHHHGNPNAAVVLT